MFTEEQKRARIVYIALLIISLVWLSSIFAAPWLIAHGHFTTSAIIYQSLSAVCHQNPERSFHFCNLPLGVCSRCTGIYLGFVIGLMLYPVLRDLSDETFPRRKWLILSSIPMLFDVGGELAGFRMSTFLSRAATGFLFGVAVAFYILPGFISASGRKSQISNRTSQT